jgi:hypothetical protein
MHRHHVVSAALLAAVLTACSSSGESSKPPNAGSPTASAQPASATFTSRISPLVGLRLTWPTAGWRPIDSPAELIVHPTGLRGASLHVTKALFPAAPDGGILTTHPSPASVIAALRRLPALRASRPVREHLGGGLAVAHIDVRLSPTGPRSGFKYLVYKGNSGNAAAFTIKKGMSVRVYAGVYRAPYGRELLDIAVEAPTGRVFARWTALAARALRSLRLPKGLLPARAYGEWGD